jgi:hypothetical protein
MRSIASIAMTRSRRPPCEGKGGHDRRVGGRPVNSRMPRGWPKGVSQPTPAFRRPPTYWRPVVPFAQSKRALRVAIVAVSPPSSWFPPAPAAPSPSALRGGVFIAPAPAVPACAAAKFRAFKETRMSASSPTVPRAISSASRSESAPPDVSVVGLGCVRASGDGGAPPLPAHLGILGAEGGVATIVAIGTGVTAAGAPLGRACEVRAVGA